MGRKNCWDFMQCGRQPGGPRSAELGVCPATTLTTADGFCGGTNGGRACAYIAGTLCGGHVQGSAPNKVRLCSGCDFYREVRRDHGEECGVLSFAAHLRARGDHERR